MRKQLFLLPLLVVAFLGFNSFTEKPKETPNPIKAERIKIPIGNTGQTISMADLATISMEELENKTGYKMNAGERKAFKATQKRLKKSIDADGNLTDKRMLKALSIAPEGDGAFSLGGLALGFLLGLIGVLIAYLIKGGDERGRRKWAWFGFGIYAVIVLIIVLASA